MRRTIVTTLLYLIPFHLLVAQVINGKYPAVLPFANQEVTLTNSWIKQHESHNTNYLRSLDPERLLYNFRVNAGIKSDAKPLDGWESPNCGLRGHFVGHYLSACAVLIEREGDTLLKRHVNYMIDELEKCQQQLGGKYLSAFPEKDFTELETKFGGVWAPYYTYHKIMQGLLDVYTLTGNKKSFQLVVNMADYVRGRMAKLSDETIEKVLYTTAANPTNEAGGMNEVLHNLYAVSKDPAHLKLAEIFDRKWFSQPLAEGKDILSGLHSNTHIVLVNGYTRRFENTGEKAYHDAAVYFWDMLVNHHCYVNGTSSGPRPISTTPTSRIAEHWGVPDHLSATLTGEIAESCVTHNTQKLTANLFRWSSEPQYADNYLNTFYNAVMATHNFENGSTVYHLPLGSPRKKNFLKENDFKCCNGTAIETFAKLNTNIYFHDNENIWVNLFIPSKVSWKEQGLTINQTGNFPEDPKVLFTIATQNPAKFKLNLLIPSWANEHTKILINGVAANVKPIANTFANIDRVWKNGDQVELVFNYNVYLKTMPDDQNVIALFYGPVLLAFGTDKELILKGSQENILKSLVKVKENFTFKLNNNGIAYNLTPFYKITGESYGVYATIRNEY